MQKYKQLAKKRVKDYALKDDQSNSHYEIISEKFDLDE